MLYAGLRRIAMSYGDLNFCHRFGSFPPPPVPDTCVLGKQPKSARPNNTKSLQSCRLKALQKAAPSDDVRHTEGARVVR